ncbi:hypothetical protein LG293_17725 (plasmid) [Citricoccus nitrophenolicus]
MENAKHSEPTRIPVKATLNQWDPTRIKSVRPTAEPDATHWLELNGDELFAVHEDSNKSDGRGPRFLHSRHLDFDSARRTAIGKGVQGSMGELSLCAPKEVPVMAYAADGTTVQVALNVEYPTVPWESRLTHIDVPDTQG